MHRHLVSCQRLAVHAQDVRDPAKVYPGRERLEHLLALARLQAKVSLAALDAQLEKVAALLVPEPDLVDRDALQHGRRRLEKLQRGNWRAVHELLRERE